MLKKLNKVANWLIIILVVVNIYNIIFRCIVNRNIEMPIVTITQTQYINAVNMLDEEFDASIDIDKRYAKDIIERDFNLKAYIYIEKELKDMDSGTLLAIRTILIDSRLSDYRYIECFVHEVVHFKKFASDEQYVCFEAFKYLYEHEELHSVGVWYGQRQLQGCYGGEYNIADLIVNYLTKTT